MSSKTGPCSSIGVRAGPDLMIMMPLSGRMGEPSCSGERLLGSENIAMESGR